MAYTPRLSAPPQNKYYCSDNIFYQSGYGMPNCTCYAWGRFYEISGSRPRLCTGNAGNWYDYTSDGYSRGKTPKLGAVAVWKKPGAAGHVAIVEKINSDGSIETSNSAWGGSYFYTDTLYPPYYSCGSYYTLQGFIYNPTVSSSGSVSTTTSSNKLAEFLKVVNDHVGDDGYWSWRTSGLTVGDAWCAAFIVACAKTVGILNKVIPLTYGAGSIARDGVGLKMGTFIRGPYFGNSATPQPGDCISFYNGGGYKYDEFYASHVGVVVEVKNGTVHTVEGNSTTWDNYTSKVGRHQYSINAKNINGYFRPDWSKVGGSVSGLNSSGTIALYDMVNTREDASVREVGYIDSKNQPSIKSSDIRLSVMNYTTFLGMLFGSSAVSELTSGESGKVDFSGLGDTNARVIGEYLVGKGLNVSMTIGFLSNIYHESRYSTSAINPFSGASGICQWLGVRKTNMINMVGSNWKNNLTGQLDYLWHELNSSEKSTLEVLKSSITTNSESQAWQATDIVLKQFGRPFASLFESLSKARRSTASEMWKKIKILPTISGTTSVNTGNNTADKVWNYFRNKGFSEAATAGILGNMMTECGGHTLKLNATLHGYAGGGTFYGLCMWSLQYFPEVNNKDADWQISYLHDNFMPKQFSSRGYKYKNGFTMSNFKQMTDVKEAARAFAIVVENPGPEDNYVYKVRQNNAVTAYNTYHK